MSQQQDLVFHTNSLISDEDLDSGNHAIHVISHNPATSPAWLVTSLVENGLVGTASVNRELRKKIDRAGVSLVSFVHPRSFWVPLARKLGVNLDTSNFTYMDWFSNLFTKDIPDPLQPDQQVTRLFDSLISKLDSQKLPGKVVIVESPEILLAATQLTSNELLRHLRRVAAHCSLLFVVVSTQEPLTSVSGTSEDPVTRITDFYVKLHHMSSLNVHVQPLPTGRAKDITGSVTVARGAVIGNVLEKEYIYHLSKDTVKLYYR